MSTQHTPGPWLWGDDYRGLYGAGPDNAVLDFAYYENMWLAGDRIEANARLLAAAPDLLAALQGAKAVLEIAAAGKGGEQHVYLESRTGSFVEVTSALIAIDAAIAKATGGAA